jgi:hypothetical protein
VVIGALLASADPVFESWFNVTPVVKNLSLIGLGAVGLLGLARAASAKEPVPELPSAPRLGTVEAVSVLGSLCVLYAAFVAAQLVALTGGADHVLETSDPTDRGYLRSTLCARWTEAAEGAAYNHAESRADQALEDVC